MAPPAGGIADPVGWSHHGADPAERSSGGGSGGLDPGGGGSVDLTVRSPLAAGSTASNAAAAGSMASCLSVNWHLAMDWRSATASIDCTPTHGVSYVGIDEAPDRALDIDNTCPLGRAVYCGRGDKKTKRGKRFNHSYGNARPRNKKKGTGPPRLFAPPAPPRKDQFDDGEIISIEIDEDILE
ncbi:unnamed protein product [Miscanthus lutarioriparius]|uniref:Uncharacterized protein n=1 Tax=Miscanthus lutarioriparius TaxID=422564 RepID=A0A811NVQ1_9POAL|nr:unnamed protein product [Miscanthus lutarioriparius]